MKETDPTKIISKLYKLTGKCLFIYVGGILFWLQFVVGKISTF